MEIGLSTLRQEPTTSSVSTPRSPTRMPSWNRARAAENTLSKLTNSLRENESRIRRLKEDKPTLQQDLDKITNNLTKW